MCHRKLGEYRASIDNFNDAIRLRKEEDADKGESYHNRAMAYLGLEPPQYEKVFYIRSLEPYTPAIS